MRIKSLLELKTRITSLSQYLIGKYIIRRRTTGSALQTGHILLAAR
jgi:hypothetical protein